MSKETRSQSVTTARFVLNVLKPRQPLFLISHMRSYSSLLSHVLNSNSQIDGYGELAISYKSPLDLLVMRHNVVLTTKQPLSGKYVFDKLLHKKFELEDSVLEASSARVMIGVREPESTVGSIMAMGQAKAKPDWKAQPARASQHYTNRLKHFVKTIETRSDCLVFPTDAIINDTDAFLSGLGGWLKLKEPLSPSYDVGPRTGRPGFGDTSANISSGVITSDRPAHDLDIPENLLDEIWDAYHRTLDTLFKRADHVLCPESRVQRAS